MFTVHSPSVRDAFTRAVALLMVVVLLAWIPFAQAVSTEHGLEQLQTLSLQHDHDHHAHEHEGPANANADEDHAGASFDHDHDLPSLLPSCAGGFAGIFHPRALRSGTLVLLTPVFPFERPPKS